MPSCQYQRSARVAGAFFIRMNAETLLTNVMRGNRVGRNFISRTLSRKTSQQNYFLKCGLNVSLLLANPPHLRRIAEDDSGSKVEASVALSGRINESGHRAHLIFEKDARPMMRADDLERVRFELNYDRALSFCFDAFSSREPLSTPGSRPRACFARKRSKVRVLLSANRSRPAGWLYHPMISSPDRRTSPPSLAWPSLARPYPDLPR
jgi:hypothetical protein